MAPKAFLITGSKHFVDSVTISKASAEKRIRERGASEKSEIVPLYAGSDALVDQLQIIQGKLIEALLEGPLPPSLRGLRDNIQKTLADFEARNL